jgi:oligopeptide/dipeptide ABC transporter ATP-binding protein
MIRLENITKRFAGADRPAVDDVTLEVPEGTTTALIGPSGCGKTTTMRMVNRMIEPSAGRILVAGADVTRADPVQLRRRIGYVIQQVGLFPHMTIAQNVATVPQLLGWERRRIAARVDELLDLVGLDPARFRSARPRALSGGQRQRVGVARAMALGPKLLVADEPTSALDVSVQAVILRLLADLRARLGMSYLFVSHDLNVVRLLCSRVVVMYLGKVVEVAPAGSLFTAPRHPYTQALVAAIPDPARRGENRPRLDGSPKSPIDPDPHVCRFYGRCPKGTDICARLMPLLKPVGPDHAAACHFA